MRKSIHRSDKELPATRSESQGTCIDKQPINTALVDIVQHRVRLPTPKSDITGGIRSNDFSLRYGDGCRVYTEAYRQARFVIVIAELRWASPSFPFREKSTGHLGIRPPEVLIERMEPCPLNHTPYRQLLHTCDPCG